MRRTPAGPQIRGTKKTFGPKGTRGVRGGTEISAALGDLLGQAYDEHLSNEHQELLEKTIEGTLGMSLQGPQRHTQPVIPTDRGVQLDHRLRVPHEANQREKRT